jgi:pyroglutamyl-peptidase
MPLSSRRLLVTGFGPFLDVDENPSATLAQHCGLPFAILPVSYRAVDAWMDELDAASFDALLMIGVAAKSEKLRLETVARNEAGLKPDIDGLVLGPGPFDAAAEFQLASSLWQSAGLTMDTDSWSISTDAGNYLCNYTFFRALQRWPEKDIGFLHVPRFEAVPQHAQETALQELLVYIDAALM